MADDPRPALRRRVLAAIAGDHTALCELIGDLWAYQTARCPVIAAHARAHGLPVGGPCRVEQIRPVPTSTWRFGDLVTWDDAREAPALELRSSGTGGGGSSLHRLRETGLYEASLHAGLEAVLPEVTARGASRWISLLPSREQWPWSSLVFMLDAWMERWDDGGGAHAAHPDGAPHLDSARRVVAQANRDRSPVLLAGAAFSHVLLLDAAGRDGLPLPEGSLVIETGGTKGRSRSVGHAELRELLRAGYDVPAEAIWSEYGMAELGSQAWGRGDLSSAGAWERPVLRFPPWVRWAAVDPDTGESVTPGEVGLLRIFDPVNLDTCAFVATFDLVRRVGHDAFSVLGRAPQAEVRGCSLAVPERPPSSSLAAPRPVRRSGPETAGSSLGTFEERAEALAAAWAELRDPAGAAGDAAALVADVVGLSLPQVREALRREAARWDAAAMGEILAMELRSLCGGAGGPSPVARSLVLPASTVPFVGLESLTVGLLAGAGVSVRPSSRNPVEVELFARALARNAPGLAELLEVLSPGDAPAFGVALAEAETLVVHGDRSTVSEIRRGARPDAAVVAYGPRWSVALLDPEDAADEALLRGLADDVLLHDSLGCMSPRAVLVPGSQAEAAKLARALGEALAERSAALPPHPDVARRPSGLAAPDEAVAALGRSGRPVESATRHATAWVLILAPASPGCPGLAVEPPAVRRGTVVAAVSEDAAPASWWPAGASELSTLGLSARARERAFASEIEASALSLGASRLSEPGRMQAPPPAWPHDGLPLVLPFLRGFGAS